MKPMTKKQAIRKIITQRKKQKLSMLKASQQGGIAQSSWWEIENGTQQPEWETVILMAKGVGLKFGVCQI
jgi:DNA-binding XRE family transcriptional regulator